MIRGTPVTVSAMGQPSDQQCDSCLQSTSGYSRADLEGSGWVWHVIQKRTNMRNESRVLIVCDSCEALYEARREAKRESPTP